MSATAENVAGPAIAYSWRGFLRYFLRLGAFGFGGPVALAGYMQRDLVERRRWIAEQDYKEGLALAQLAPGPLAAQLAMYLGWVRGRAAGAALVGTVFVLPSFVLVLAISALYVRFQGLPWMQDLFYGVGATVIAIIARSVQKLGKLTLGKDRVLWTLFAVNGIVTAWTEAELVWAFVASGFLAMVVKSPPRFGASAGALGIVPVWLFAGIHGGASAATLWTISWYFAEAGAFVFGSGLAIVPFLHGGVVARHHWLDERQFLDAVAVAMITPGPVVITVAFIGYLVAGPAGALVAALATFLPCYFFTVVPAPYFRRFANNVRLKAFVNGVAAAATGAIAGAGFVLGKRAIVDVPTTVIAIASLALLVKFQKLPEPALVAAAGAVGVILKEV